MCWLCLFCTQLSVTQSFIVLLSIKVRYSEDPYNTSGTYQYSDNENGSF